jgi:hypothetical protein
MSSMDEDPFRKDLDSLVFLEDRQMSEKDKESRIVDDNIFYVDSEKANPDFFMQNLRELFLKKIEILIKSFIREADSLNNQKSDDDEQNKRLKSSINLKNKADKCILLGDYRQSSMLYGTLIDLGKQLSDNILIAKSFEGVGICLFLMDFTHSRRNPEYKFKFNTDVETNLNNSAEKYKKLKINECYLDILFKLVYYYLMFEGKTKNFFDTIKRIVEELEMSNTFFKFNCLLKIYYLFDSLNLKRKGAFYLYLAFVICLDNPELQNIVPFILNELVEKYHVYDILNVKINSFDEFLKHHKEVKRFDWKKNSFETYTQNNTFVKTIFKKRVEKGNKLVVKNRISNLRPFILTPVWENIQNNLYKSIVNFYSKQNYSK